MSLAELLKTMKVFAKFFKWIPGTIVIKLKLNKFHPFFSKI